MTDYLHGVETISQEATTTVQDATTSIIAAVVTAPTFLLENDYKTLNKPVPIRNYQDVAKYAGKNITGFTACDALETILTESGGATIYMINVFDETKHKTSTTDTIQLTAGQYTFDKDGISNLVVKSGDKTGSLGTDYTLTDGVLSVISGGAFASATSLDLTYDFADYTKITPADIIGTVDDDGIKTGIKAIENVQSLYGDEVSILLAPTYSALKSVRTALETMETTLKAYSYTDTPVGTSINAAIAARLSAKDSLDLTSSSATSMVCYPNVYRYNSTTGKDELRPLSPVAAGLRVKLDRTRNVAKNIDNTKSVTTTATELPIGFRLNDANSESNALNSKGISTIINYKGSYYFWGGRSANYPTISGIKTFEHVQRTASFIERSIQNTSFVCVGESITQGFIDDVLNMCQSFFNRLKNPQNKIIIDGEIHYDKSLNPVDNLADGHIRFPYSFCPPPTAERITYYSFIDIQILKSLGGNE